MLESDVIQISLARWTSKVALKPGSSKQGKARRASVGENCVEARYLSTKTGLVLMFKHCEFNCKEIYIE